jgi:hypothetical protein
MKKNSVSTQFFRRHGTRGHTVNWRFEISNLHSAQPDRPGFFTIAVGCWGSAHAPVAAVPDSAAVQDQFSIQPHFGPARTLDLAADSAGDCRIATV